MDKSRGNRLVRDKPPSTVLPHREYTLSSSTEPEDIWIRRSLVDINAALTLPTKPETNRPRLAMDNRIVQREIPSISLPPIAFIPSTPAEPNDIWERRSVHEKRTTVMNGYSLDCYKKSTSSLSSLPLTQQFKPAKSTETDDIWQRRSFVDLSVSALLPAKPKTQRPSSALGDYLVQCELILLPPKEFISSTSAEPNDNLERKPVNEETSTVLDKYVDNTEVCCEEPSISMSPLPPTQQLKPSKSTETDDMWQRRSGHENRTTAMNGCMGNSLDCYRKSTSSLSSLPLTQQLKPSKSTETEDIWESKSYVDISASSPLPTKPRAKRPRSALGNSMYGQCLVHRARPPIALCPVAFVPCTSTESEYVWEQKFMNDGTITALEECVDCCVECCKKSSISLPPAKCVPSTSTETKDVWIRRSLVDINKRSPLPTKMKAKRPRSTANLRCLTVDSADAAGRRPVTLLRVPDRAQKVSPRRMQGPRLIEKSVMKEPAKHDTAILNSGCLENQPASLNNRIPCKFDKYTTADMTNVQLALAALPQDDVCQPPTQNVPENEEDVESCLPVWIARWLAQFASKPRMFVPRFVRRWLSRCCGYKDEGVTRLNSQAMAMFIGTLSCKHSQELQVQLDNTVSTWYA